MTMDYALLISLLICHFVADYVLTTPAMIEAKATGKRMIHIVLHAGIHTVLMGGVLIVFGATIYVTSMLVLLEPNLLSFRCMILSVQINKHSLIIVASISLIGTYQDRVGVAILGYASFCCDNAATVTFGASF